MFGVRGRYSLGSSMISAVRLAHQLPLLYSEAFLHMVTRPLWVFLCGRQLGERHFDERMQFRRLLETKMGCRALLGEDISQLSPKVDQDHLTIEVSVGKRCDLIVMFLGSPGTFAELTAFAMNSDTNGKLVVFNEDIHRGKKTFINLGPLRLLPPERVIYYDREQGLVSREVIRRLDLVVAERRFETMVAPSRTAVRPHLNFHEFIVLMTVFVASPIRHGRLIETVPLGQHQVREALSSLCDRHLVHKQEAKWVYSRDVEAVFRDCSLVRGIGRLRASMLSQVLSDEEGISDYRLLF